MMGRRVFEPVAVLPCQVTSPLRGPAEGPRRLLAALLEDALRCASQEVQDDSWREAARWVFSNDRGYVFSFLSVCDALKMDPKLLRGGRRGERNEKPPDTRSVTSRRSTDVLEGTGKQAELVLGGAAVLIPRPQSIVAAS